ncbi:2-alkenal reductase [Penicillium argentinense]|uniref:2-alkenal reductase n=1 Tax=Penicillium argentinense TaxID=1131581 RepID=A0A9W9EHY0_9EURO|nr:2-alkenal reductase [Penicillium argentinense]KAJ5082015.1 2-alkenal reductase [Penicillium argentinense]
MAPESARKTTELTEDMASDRGWSNSRLFTLITSDVTRIQAVWEMVHLLWTAPISIGVALLTLSFNIGKSAIWGCIIIVLGMIVITSAVRGMAKEQKLVTKLTDQRSSMAREVSRSIHVLKLFGWESKFLARFRCIRTQETRRIREIHSTHTWIQALWASLPTFATMGSLIAYSMSTDKFEPMAIFSTLATFNALRPLLNMLPLVIGQVLQSLEALAKVEKFLLENEPDDYIQSTPKANLAIRLDHATLGWYKPSTSDLDKGNEIHQNPVSKIAASSFLLSDLSLTVRPNEMLAVIGLTGSGKSSFLAALAGDMNLVEGVVQVNGTRAFCPQHAWMQNSSIRDNILFGREYNAARYHEVLRCCALKADIEKLADGDSTEVGDRGASLSGGQKARISLARAVYARTDIVIMDDPVASIDSNVGHHIMENVLCGLLKNCCRIVATHSPSILHRCDRILIIEDGRIKAIDTFDRLIRQGVLRNGFFSSPSENAITHNGPRKCDGRKSVRDKVKSRKAELHTKFVPPADVSWNGWKTYLSAGGTHLNCLAIIFLSILGNGMSLICSSWLSYWTSGKHLDMSNKKCAAVYAFLSVTQAILLACSTLCMMARGITASKELLQQVMMRIVRAPMSFYETGCLGTVIQQITVETGILDVHLTNCIRLFSMKAITTSLVVAVTVYHCHYFVLAVGPLIYLFLHVARRYRATAGKLHQHKSKRQSKLHAGLSETISGLSCIRGYGAWNHFKENIHSDIYAMNEIHLLSAACPRWLTIRLDAIGIALTSLVGVLGVVPWSGVSPSVFGMLFTNMLSISQTLQLAMRNMNEVMNGLRVVEGIVYYKTNIPQEASLGAEESQSMPNDEMCQQPQAGRISFLNASMRYRPGLPLALTDVNIDIQNGEMIAILGRTGAGKSSIIAALLRMTELSGGAIEIDGTDIAAMRLHDLRSAVAVIPQDVALFAGSIRSNVDPFHEYEDMRIYNVLKKVGLVHDQGPFARSRRVTVSIASMEQWTRLSVHLCRRKAPIYLSATSNGSLWPALFFAMLELSFVMRRHPQWISRWTNACNKQSRRSSTKRLFCTSHIEYALFFAAIGSASWDKVASLKLAGPSSCGVEQMGLFGQCVTEME